VLLLLLLEPTLPIVWLLEPGAAAGTGCCRPEPGAGLDGNYLNSQGSWCRRAKNADLPKVQARLK
jgi:hypothetical protein